MMLVKKKKVFWCGRNCDNYSVSSSGVGEVAPDCSCAAPYSLWQLCCLILSVAVFIWIPRSFSCGFFIFPYTPSAFFFYSAFFGLQLLHFTYCLHLLVLQSNAVWGWVYCEQWSFGKEKKAWWCMMGRDLIIWQPFVGFAGEWSWTCTSWCDLSPVQAGNPNL